MKSLHRRRWPMLAASAVVLLIAVTLVLFLVWQVRWYGCAPGISTPVVAARDVAAFNAVLASNSAFTGLHATAVHGHEVDVTESNERAYAPNDYAQVGGISDKLRDAWMATFVRLHPHAWNARIVTIRVIDKQGGDLIISVGQCVWL